MIEKQNTVNKIIGNKNIFKAPVFMGFKSALV